MSTASFAATFSRLRTASTPSDGQLLEAYSAANDQAAFAALVGRHGPMVFGVCRRVLQDTHDAEDAFQAAFLVLATRAASIRRTESLTSWLYGVAYRLALRAKRDAGRRRKHESRAEPRTSSPAWEVGWRELQGILDEEVQRLAPADRAAFVLCCLEGLSKPEAAERLGIKANTVSSQLARARKRLQQRLARRGISLTAVLAALAVSGAGQAAVSPRLARMPLTEPSARALILAQGATAPLLTNNLKLAAVLLLALCAVGAGLGVLARPAATPPAAANKARSVSPPTPAKPKDGAIEVRGRVLDSAGKSRADVGIYLARTTMAPALLGRQAISGKDGRFQFRLDPAAFAKADGRPNAWRFANVIAVADGFGPAWASAGQEGELTLRLVPDVPLEGRILTLEGRPVAGARLRLGSLSAWASEAELSAYLRALAAGEAPPRPVGLLRDIPGRANEWTADDRGQVRITGLGRDRLALLEVTGSGIAHDTILAVTRPGKTVIARPGPGGAPKFYPAKFEHAARPGRVLTGKALDATTGRPVAGIEVAGGGAPPRSVTDAEGRYELAGLPKASKYTLYLRPARAGVPYLPVRIEVKDTTGVGPLRADLRVPRGIPLRVRVHDPATGKLMPAWVSYVPLFPNKNAPENLSGLLLSAHLQPDGSYRGVALPGPGAVCVRCSAGDYLPAAVNQKTFFRLDRLPGDEKVLPAGEMLWTAGRSVSPLPQRQFQVIRFIDPAPDAKEVSLTLKPDPGRSATIRLQDADGRPLPGVRVWDWRRGEEWGAPLPTAELKVSGLGPGRPRYLVFHHDGRKLAGAVVVQGNEAGAVSVGLRPWGTATGRLVDAAGKPLPRHELRGGNAPPGREKALTLPGAVRTDDQGRFRLDGLVPGRDYYLMVSKYLPEVGEFIGVGRLADPVTVRPGATKDLGDVKLKAGFK
jgi:RNA polymerase sigma factor (sigma-70 family)